MARLSHPNVLTVYEVGRFDESLFLVMVLAAGAASGAIMGRAEDP